MIAADSFEFEYDGVVATIAVIMTMDEDRSSNYKLNVSNRLLKTAEEEKEKGERFLCGDEYFEVI